MRGARRYSSAQRGNPYAAMQHRSLMREMQRYESGYSEIRDSERPVTWEDVHRLRERLWNAQQRDLNICRERSAGIPENWIVKPSKTGGGIRFIDPENPHNSVRLMPGDPNSPYPNSRMPYVRWLRNGKSLDANGNIVPKNSPDAHIPINSFQYSSGGN